MLDSMVKLITRPRSFSGAAENGSDEWLDTHIFLETRAVLCSTRLKQRSNLETGLSERNHNVSIETQEIRRRSMQQMALWLGIAICACEAFLRRMIRAKGISNGSAG